MNLDVFTAGQNNALRAEPNLRIRRGPQFPIIEGANRLPGRPPPQLGLQPDFLPGQMARFDEPPHMLDEFTLTEETSRLRRFLTLTDQGSPSPVVSPPAGSNPRSPQFIAQCRDRLVALEAELYGRRRPASIPGFGAPPAPGSARGAAESPTRPIQGPSGTPEQEASPSASATRAAVATTEADEALEAAQIARRGARLQSMRRLRDAAAMLRVLGTPAQALGTVVHAMSVGADVAQATAIVIRVNELGDQRQAESDELDRELAQSERGGVRTNPTPVTGYTAALASDTAQISRTIRNELAIELFSARRALDPSHWDVSQLGAGGIAILLIGRRIWPEINANSADSFLAGASRRLDTFNIPDIVFTDANRGILAAFRNRGASNWDLSHDFISRLSSFGLIQYLVRSGLITVNE